MRTQVKKDVLEILEEVIDILKVKEDKDTLRLKKLSTYIVNDSFVFQDADAISIGVLIYALSKMIERYHADEKLAVQIKDYIINARDFLRKDNFGAYRKEITKLFKFLSSLDKKLKIYIQETINQAKLKKGFGLFQHGMSIAKASKLMGITRWELMNYVGHTKVFDKENISTNVKKRLAFTRSLFK